MIFETHAHYDDKAFYEDKSEVLKALEAGGIRRVVNIGSSFNSCKDTLKLMEEYPFIYGALGIHPSDTAEMDDTVLSWIEKESRHEKCVAVGEIGLDYYWPEPDKEVQKKWFIRQLELARKLNLPVVIHSRNAAMETIEIMKECQAEEIGGVIHCFSYSKEIAKIFLDMGFYIGIGGVITFKNAKKLKEAVSYIPMDRIVVETDSPYLAPEPNRGKRNNSLNLPYVIEAISHIKQISPAQVEEATWNNGNRLYRI